MKWRLRMETTGKENATNHEINLQAEALTDLPLADEQAGETKAGASGTGKTMAAEVLGSQLRSTNDM